MQLSSILVLAGAAIAAASPLAGQQLRARDPSDKSGNSYVVFHTQSGTYPNTPESSEAFFQNNLKYRGPDGVDHTDLPCTQPWTDKNCYVSNNFLFDRRKFSPPFLTRPNSNAPSPTASSTPTSWSRPAGARPPHRRSPSAITATTTTLGAASPPAATSSTTSPSAALRTLPATLTPRV